MKAKPYHLAKLISRDGKVSPLCAKNPRAINLKRASWTTDEKAVTCVTCVKKIQSQFWWKEKR